jgi:hypothetical protein
MIVGYARVSTRDQDFASQVAELTAAGCAKVYREKASGARGDRAELAKLMRRLDRGDVLVVTRLDRLARSTRDLLNTLEKVKDEPVQKQPANDRPVEGQGFTKDERAQEQPADIIMDEHRGGAGRLVLSHLKQLP